MEVPCIRILNKFGISYTCSLIVTFVVFDYYVFFPHALKNTDLFGFSKLIILYLTLNVLANYYLMLTNYAYKEDGISKYLLDRYCTNCQKDVPGIAHHCPLCRTCILKKDHHCFFTGK